MTVSIREANRDDARAVAGLFERIGNPISEEQAGKRLDQLTGDGNSRLFIAEGDSGLVGLVGLHIMHVLEHDHPAGVVIAFIVGPGEQGQETGRRLMGIAEHVAKQQGCFSLMTNTANNRESAQDFYRTLGFRQSGQQLVKRLAPTSQ